MGQALAAKTKEALARDACRLRQTQQACSQPAQPTSAAARAGANGDAKGNLDESGGAHAASETRAPNGTAGAAEAHDG